MVSIFPRKQYVHDYHAEIQRLPGSNASIFSGKGILSNAFRYLIPPQEIEKRIEIHDQQPHNCSNDFLCKVLADRDSEKNQLGHYETVNVLFEAL